MRCDVGRLMIVRRYLRLQYGKLNVPDYMPHPITSLMRLHLPCSAHSILILTKFLELYVKEGKSHLSAWAMLSKT